MIAQTGRSLEELGESAGLAFSIPLCPEKCLILFDVPEGVGIGNVFSLDINRTAIFPPSY
jgi:hypothetical protein